jgi:hypothetical protein
MNNVEYLDKDFGIIDFNLKRMTFEGQDAMRLLIDRFGAFLPEEVKLDQALRGLGKTLEAFVRYCGGTNEPHRELRHSIGLAIAEVEVIREQHSLNYVTASISERHSMKIRKWKLIEACDDLNSNNDILKYVGAFCSFLLSGRNVAANIEGTLWHLIRDGEGTLANSEPKAIAKLLNRGRELFSGETKSYNNKIRSHYYCQKIYSSNKDRQSILGWSAMTHGEYLNITAKLFQEVEQGCPNALVDTLSLITGLTPDIVLLTPILSHSLDDWIAVIDISNGTVLFDLSEIFPNGAQAKSGTNHFEKSSSTLVKPLPEFIAKSLLELLRKNPDAQDIKTLVGVEPRKKKTSNQSARLLKTTAPFAIRYCQIDPFDACVLSGDFRGIASAKAYYRRTTRQASWDATQTFYSAIGWGASVPLADGLAFGSKVVVKDEAVTEVFEHLASNVESLRPSNRCSVKKLLEFHNVFCNYTATCAIYCLALRNSNPIPLLSRELQESQSYVIIDDKHVLGDASALPVAVTPLLAKQLAYWRIHCAKLIARLEGANFSDKKFINLLKGVVEYKDSALFVVANRPYSVSVASVASNWNISLVENFSRHYWESKFSQVGVSSRFSAAHLRHQVSGVLSWASDSDFVLREFIKAISTAQEKVLQELRISPLHGLARR